MIRPNPLQQLRDLDRAPSHFHKQLSNCPCEGKCRSAVLDLQGEDLAWLVEYLHVILISISDPTNVTFQESMHELREICRVKGVLPKSCTLSTFSLVGVSLPSASGYVCEGTLDGSNVHIKRVRMFPRGDPQEVKETFHEAAVVWRHLKHPNVVPLLGVTVDPPLLVSDWMCGGDLTEYITNHPDADKPSLLSCVAEGLSYLHSCNVIHGDLKGSNIFIDPAGCARIANFGLAVVTQNTTLMKCTWIEYGHGVRWIAPEILDDRGTHSREGDVFSFAMVAIETFTGAVPFSNKPPHAAMLAIVGGERPPRPVDPTLTDRLWALIQQCWDQEAQLRPQLLQIVYDFRIPAWKRLTGHERISLITTIFSDRDVIGVIERLRGDDAQFFVDMVDKALDSLTPRLRKKCLRALCKICGRQALLPRSLQIPLCYNRLDNALYSGGYADVWMGEHQGRKVAVKVLRLYSTSNLGKVINRFCKEAVTWKSLCHPNVLPLLGVTMSDKRFAMVSEWMINGNINEFVKTHGDANRFELLKDVARGLIYMHSQAMIHADLKGANILVDQKGCARLADFGLLTIVSDPTYSTTSSSRTNAGTTRWMSPELLDQDRFCSKNCRPTKESDCYALGMVILEVLTGQVPFPRYSGLIVMRKVIEGEHPDRPQGAERVWFTDYLWGTLEWCWQPQPETRPTIQTVLEHLERASTDWQPLPPSAGGDVEADSDDELTLTVSRPGHAVHPHHPPPGSVSRRSAGSSAHESGGFRISSIRDLPGASFRESLYPSSIRSIPQPVLLPPQTPITFSPDHSHLPPLEMSGKNKRARADNSGPASGFQSKKRRKTSMTVAQFPGSR